LVVALFLFQIGTGLFFAWRLTAAPTDRFRTFQIASGVYLAFYVLGHYGFSLHFRADVSRHRHRVGLRHGRANRPRQGPVEHPPRAALLARRVLCPGASRGWGACGRYGAWRRKAFADRFMVSGAVAAGIVATVIMLGMCGMRVQFI